jgi:anti-sigma factor RsiW
MSVHLAVDWLSAHVDGALGPADRRRADAHLAECAECRTRLEGLRVVAAALGDLPREATPRALDLVVAPRRPLRLGRPAAGPRRPPALAATPLLVPFAGIVAITVILLALAALRLPGWPAGDSAPSAPRKLDLRAMPPDGGAPTLAWWRVDGRLFGRTGSLWREVEGPAKPPRPASPAERRAILAARPELAALRSTATWEVVWKGERLRLELAASAAAPEAQEER